MSVKEIDDDDEMHEESKEIIPDLVQKLKDDKMK